MATLIDTFHEAIASRAQDALVALAARQPQITAAELAELLASNPTLGSLTLNTLTTSLGRGGAVVVPKRRGRPPGRKSTNQREVAAAPAPAAKRKPASPGKRNVRTEPGREQFDQDVLGALREAGGESVSATTLRGIVGSDPIQLRTALNRLISSELVTFSGKARGTRYSLVREEPIIRPQIRRAGGPGFFGVK
jgi:hypothetical protein